MLRRSATPTHITAAPLFRTYQGSLNFNGSDTLTVLSTDGNGATDSDTVAITVSSVNDVPGNIVPSASSRKEQHSLSLAVVSVNELERNLSTTKPTISRRSLEISVA